MRPMRQQPKVVKEPAFAAPAFNTLVKLETDINDFDDLPDSPNPYFIAAQEGVYLHKRTLFGRAFLQSNPPSTLGSVGSLEKGWFKWTGPRVPADLCSQIVDFFRRVWKDHKAEAEVLLTLNPETQKWKIFIPTQRVSSGGVRSVYDPAHIDPAYIVVGSMHSHCNFGAFHSGTDKNDATDGEGLHFTVGHVDWATPEVVAMAMINGVDFHFKNVDGVADFSKLGSASAPEWWDQYLTTSYALNPKDKPVGFDLFEKFGINDIPPTRNYAVGSYQGGSYHGGYQYGNQNQKKDDNKGKATTLGDLIGKDEKDEKKTSKSSSEDEEFSRLLVEDYYKNKGKKNDKALIPLNEDFERYFAKDLSLEVQEAILASDLMTSQDMTDAKRIGGADLGWYRLRFLQKYADARATLEALGLDIENSEDGLTHILEVKTVEPNKRPRGRKNKERVN